jgi:hypothetical protein
MAVIDIGCCGAYCGTCRAYAQGACRGCKHGYDTGERDLRNAKCAMKVCCIQKNFPTCADCPEYPVCGILQAFYGKNGRKYQKYRQATLYIRTHGYGVFLESADRWTNACGKYP